MSGSKKLPKTTELGPPLPGESLTKLIPSYSNFTFRDEYEIDYSFTIGEMCLACGARDLENTGKCKNKDCRNFQAKKRGIYCHKCIDVLYPCSHTH